MLREMLPCPFLKVVRYLFSHTGNVHYHLTRTVINKSRPVQVMFCCCCLHDRQDDTYNIVSVGMRVSIAAELLTFSCIGSQRQ